jgi:hypothetical protein
VVILMVYALLMRASDIHASSPATPYAHFNRLVLFCYCSSFLSLCYVVTLQYATVDFRSKLDCNSCFYIKICTFLSPVVELMCKERLVLFVHLLRQLLPKSRFSPGFCL